MKLTRCVLLQNTFTLLVAVKQNFCKTKFVCLGLKDLREATVKGSSVFWDVMPCSPAKIQRHFTETYCLHHQSRRQQNRACRLLLADFLLGLFFYHENGSSKFIRYAGERLPDHTALHARRKYCDMTPESRNSEVRVDVHC
jgi:hypothetical protein